MSGVDGTICVIAGGDNGLGGAVATAPADHGARPVVNDLGTSVHGEGADPSVAESVAADRRDAGGEAVVHAGDVSDSALRLPSSPPSRGTAASTSSRTSRVSSGTTSPSG